MSCYYHCSLSFSVLHLGARRAAAMPLGTASSRVELRRCQILDDQPGAAHPADYRIA